MNHESAWRLALGRRVAAEYAKNPKLGALVVAGSVGRGWADEWSDIELDLFWNEPPTDGDRKRVIEAINGQLVYYFPLEGDEWSDAYFVDGLKFELSSFLVATLDQFITDVTQHADDDREKQLRMAALLNSIPLYGNDLIEGWRARARQYPDALAEKIIRANVEFGGWDNVEFSFARGELLMAYHFMTKVQLEVYFVLLALNRIYLGNPRGKWISHFVDQMKHKPARLAERIQAALRAGTPEGAREFDDVILETLDLVADQFPQIDLTDIRKTVSFRRKTIAR